MVSASPGVPAFSVVICTYNRAGVLPGAVASVLGQTFDDYELVVVDDGSEDDTPAVVRSFEDPRVRYVRRANGGLSAARNTGVERATGRAVAFLDDDDEALPHWLERMHAGAAGDPRAVVTCGETVIDERGAVVETHLPADLGPAFEGYRGLFIPGTFTVPRAAYQAAGGFAEGLQCSHQTEFALRLLPLCREHGWPVSPVDAALIRRVLRPAEQRLRTPSKILDGTRYILARHEAALARSPSVLADYLATAGVAAARTGDYPEARRLLGRAARTRPTRWRHAARWALACVPSLGDLVWKRRRYETR